MALSMVALHFVWLCLWLHCTLYGFVHGCIALCMALSMVALHFVWLCPWLHCTLYGFVHGCIALCMALSRIVLRPGHLSKFVGDSSRRREEIVKISYCVFQACCCYHHHHHHYYHYYYYCYYYYYYYYYYYCKVPCKRPLPCKCPPPTFGLKLCKG